MREGDVVLAVFRQADGDAKARPTVALREMPPYRDLLLCGLSTQLHQQVEDFDEIISASDDDFLSSGLVATSLVRLGFLAAVPRKRIIGALGRISPARHERLVRKLSNYLVQAGT